MAHETAPSPEGPQEDLIAWAERMRDQVRAEAPAAMGAFTKYLQVLKRELSRRPRFTREERIAYELAQRDRARELGARTGFGPREEA